MCTQNFIAVSQHTTLDDAFAYAEHVARAGDCILLSPAGSSYDLFTNYEERGNHFKELIQNMRK
jgi:UDP-N-acetylmuramoylalanine--D-glutamate ligase